MKIYNDFKKVLDVLHSCSNYQQIAVAEKMFENFCKSYNIKWFDNNNVFVSHWDNEFNSKIFSL